MKIPERNSIQQTPAALAIVVTAKPDNVFFSTAKKEESDALLFAFVTPKEVNDPAQWDEAWFASYE